jgi:4-amino-4-deoxy-L-arabinose transferase-like glycosyltransferase
MVCILALYYRHLHADFPNYSPWNDWAKFTDEGWYGDAAIRHSLFGRWFLPGDFNPGVALPVLPFLEALLFHFTGATLAAARMVTVTCFAGSLIGVFFLMRRYQSGVVAELAVLLLLVNPFNFAFIRLGICEPPLILFTLLLLLACSCAQWRRWLPLVLAGVLLTLVVFAKTTGLVIVPAALYLLWRANNRDTALFLRSAIVAGGVAAALAGTYLGAVAHSGHWLDFTYFFAANARPVLTLHSRWDAVRGALWDGHWMGSWIYVAMWAVVVMGLTWLRRLGRNPLFGACILWVAGYLVFIAWHCSMQPRYYLPALPPAVMLVCLALEYAWRSRRRVLTAALLLVVVAALAHDIPMTRRWAMHPEYSYWEAAHALDAVIVHDPQPNRLLMSISDSQITLMTGLRSVCDDFGTDDVEVRILRYKPGWYASWDDIDAGTLESLARFYTVEPVAAWPAMDDPERRVLRLWRLVPKASPNE